MSALLSVRDRLHEFYYRFDFILKPLQKFLLAFLTLFLLQRYIGYMEFLSRPLVIAAAAAVCALLPYGGLTFVMAVFCLADFYRVSLMLMVLTLVIMLFITALYFGFKPGNSVVIAVTVLAFMLKLPYAVPLILGLTVGAASAVPAALGVLMWFMVQYVHVNHDSLVKGMSGASNITGELIRLSRDIFENKYMYLVILAFVLAVIITGIISRLSINHCWTIAVIAGTAVLAVVMVLMGALSAETSFAADIVSLCISFIIAFAFELMYFAVDFKNVERVEFEDDDYYYYVKAVPKLKANDDSDRI